ncbi:hypothetical protein G6011_06780 [Alternaria panax]|uniref:F-box domain-containing protein n=1 Tax=Alternaria panax TaxID=48097 RepID=A0AAD4I8C4_9PLEO|nr:hypothetical protein G6011_06780 [Alternaria panax]
MEPQFLKNTSLEPQLTISPLLNLPSELLHDVLSYLDLSDLLTASMVSKALREHTHQDMLWQRFMEAQVPTITKPSTLSWRELFQQHHPYWFIARRKIWFSDTAHTGKLLIARYDYRLNAIEAYALVAERRVPSVLSWEQHPEAIIHTFDPKVRLDLNAPIIRLNKDAYEEAIGPIGYRLQKEIRMGLYRDRQQQAASLFSQLMLTRPWPTAITGDATPVWPPLTLPSETRTRNDTSPSGFRQPGQKPSILSQLSTSTFRIRRWMEFSTRALGLGMRIGEDVTTWATLPEHVYTPTKQKPWQGIWCGDYAGHGCEFLVVMQPDDPKPLPDRAQWALLARERDGSVSSEGSWTTAPTDAALGDGGDAAMENADNLEDSVATLQEAYYVQQIPSSSSSSSAPQSRHAAAGEDESVYTGRIEAVKLTGDPNIPRGEYTFIAPDIGPNGLIRVAKEEIFRGARIVKSVGHIAATGFRDGMFASFSFSLAHFY